MISYIKETTTLPASTVSSTEELINFSSVNQEDTLTTTISESDDGYESREETTTDSSLPIDNIRTTLVVPTTQRVTSSVEKDSLVGTEITLAETKVPASIGNSLEEKTGKGSLISVEEVTHFTTEITTPVEEPITEMEITASTATNYTITEQLLTQAPHIIYNAEPPSPTNSTNIANGTVDIQNTGSSKIESVLLFLMTISNSRTASAPTEKTTTTKVTSFKDLTTIPPGIFKGSDKKISPASEKINQYYNQVSSGISKETKSYINAPLFLAAVPNINNKLSIFNSGEITSTPDPPTRVKAELVAATNTILSGNLPTCGNIGKYPSVSCNRYYECVRILWWHQLELRTCPLGEEFNTVELSCAPSSNCVDV